MENSEIELIEKKTLEYEAYISSIESEINNLEIINNSIYPLSNSLKLASDTIHGGFKIAEGMENFRSSFADKDFGEYNEHRDKISNAMVYGEAAVSVGSTVVGVVGGIINFFNDRKIKKENEKRLARQKIELEELKVKFKKLAIEKLDYTKEVYASVSQLVSKPFSILQDSCKVILPITDSVRIKSSQRSINMTIDSYFKVLKLKSRIEFVISVFLEFINGQGNIRNVTKVSDDDIKKLIYIQIYNFSNIVELINSSDAYLKYYNAGISQGAIYCLSNDEVLQLSDKWSNTLNKLKDIYSDGIFNSSPFFWRSKDDKMRIKYNNALIEYIPGLDSVYKRKIKEKRKKIFFLSLPFLAAVLIALFLFLIFRK